MTPRAIITRYCHCLLLIGLTSLSPADARSVTFDLPRTIACAEARDGAHSYKHITVPLLVSAVLSTSHQTQLAQCEFEIYTLDDPRPVIDFAPKTTLVTDIQGAISVTQDNNDQNAQQVGGGGSFDGVVRAEASLSSSEHRSSTTHFEQLPARDLLAASGTIRRGTGAFFKLRKTSQTTLEGTQSFELVLEVPASWRAGYLRVVCRPSLERGADQWTLRSQSFLVPIYIEGDSGARVAAEKLIAAEHRLLRLARKNMDQVERARRPSFVHRLALAEPELPKDWLDRAIWRRSDEARLPFTDALPAEIAQAVEDLHASRQALISMNGQPSEADGRRSIVLN